MYSDRVQEAIDRFLKTKTFAFVFIVWVLVINVLYYMQFKDIFIIFLKKLGFMH